MGVRPGREAQCLSLWQPHGMVATRFRINPFHVGNQTLREQSFAVGAGRNDGLTSKAA